MSILYRSTSSNSSTGSNSVVVTKPSGCVDNDLLVLIINATTTDDVEISDPAGWTAVGGEFSAGGAWQQRHYKVYTKTASSEGADYTITTTAVADGIIAAIMCFYGTAGETLVLRAKERVAGSDPTTPINMSPVSMAFTGCSVLSYLCEDPTNTITVTAASGFTQATQVQHTDSTGDKVTLFASYKDSDGPGTANYDDMAISATANGFNRYFYFHVTVPIEPNVDIVAGTSGGGTSSPITIDKPTGTIDGDLMFMTVGCYDSLAGTPTITTPSGWTLVPETAGGNLEFSSTTDHRVCWYKVADSEPASYSVSHNGELAHGMVVTVRPATDYSADTDVTTQKNNGTLGPVSWTWGASTDDSLCLAMNVWRAASSRTYTPFTNPPNFVELVDSNTGPGATKYYGAYCCYGDVGPYSYANPSASGTATDGNTGFLVHVTATADAVLGDTLFNSHNF